MEEKTYIELSEQKVNPFDYIVLKAILTRLNKKETENAAQLQTCPTS